MKPRLTTWCVRGMLALASLGLAAAAQASTIYNFTFTIDGTNSIIAAGSFTTGAVNPENHDYFLLESMKINAIIDGTGTLWGPFVATSMLAGPSYDPITHAFTTFDKTGTQPGLGDVIFGNSPTGGALILDTTSFTVPHYFAAYLTDKSGPYPWPPSTVVRYVGNADLVITAAPTVPEPTTLLLLGTGLMGAVVSRRKRLTTR